MTILSEISIVADDKYSRRQQRFDDANLGWMGHAVLAEHLFEFGSQNDMRVWLDSTLPQENKGTIYDEKRNARLDIETSVRKLGLDNGKDQLVDLSGYLVQIRDYIRSTNQSPGNEHMAVYLDIINSPFP